MPPGRSTVNERIKPDPHHVLVHDLLVDIQEPRYWLNRARSPALLALGAGAVWLLALVLATGPLLLSGRSAAAGHGALVLALGAVAWWLTRHATRRQLAALAARTALLTRLAAVDDVTALANRRAFIAQLWREMAHARRTGRPLAVALMDLDGFKQINDTLGHASGDEVLRQFGALLLEHLRPGDLAARYGGDEFALILPHTDQHAALRLGERIKAATATRTFHIRAHGPAVHVRVSVGTAALRPEMSDPSALLDVADEALYADKHRLLPFASHVHAAER